MNLESNSIRIEAPIPGKSTVGIEVPNPVKSVVAFGDLLANKDYLNDGKPLNVILGKNKVATEIIPIIKNILCINTQ